MLFLSFSSLAHAMDEPPQGISVKQINASIKEEEDYNNSELNLMWLNSKEDPEQKGLFPNDKEAFFQNMILGWVQKNTGLKSSINMWYDSKTTSAATLAKTQADLKASLQENAQKLTFRDIWDLNVDAFKDQNIYFKADAVRMVVALRHGYHKDPSLPRYVFYSDLDIPSRSLSSLFTDKTRIRKYGEETLIDILKAYGFALPVNNAGKPQYENSWLAFDSQHEIAVQALKFGILEINRKRAEHFTREKVWDTWTPAQIKSKSQIVFTSFPTMMQYYKYLTGEYGICDEEGCGGDPDKMPKTLQGKIAEFLFPQELFSLTEAQMTRKCIYAKIIGGQRCLCKASEGDLRELTIQVDKPMSSFYFK